MKESWTGSVGVCLATTSWCFLFVVVFFVFNLTGFLLNELAGEENKKIKYKNNSTNTNTCWDGKQHAKLHTLQIPSGSVFGHDGC